MSECRDVEPLFTPYVDGEIASAGRASVDVHLGKCPPCRERVRMERTARDVLVARRDRVRPQASETLRTRCACRPADAPVASRVRRRAWVPLSLAATMLLAVAGVFVFGLNDHVQALAAQLAIDHVKCFKIGVDGSDTVDSLQAAARWRQEQGWALEVPATSAAVGLQLCAVRRCFTTDGRMAHLMYKWHGQPLSVFVIPETIGQEGPQALVEKFGQEAVIWTERGRTYVVLAEARPAELEPVVSYVRNHAR